MFKQIVVGVDDHRGGRDAIALARKLLAPDGHMTLVYVCLEDPYVYRGMGGVYQEAAREQADALLERAREQAGIDVEVRSMGGTTVGRALHAAVEDARADLLVIGSCRRSLLGRVLVGDDAHAALGGIASAVAVAPAAHAELDNAHFHRIGVGFDGSPESRHALEVARGIAAETGAFLSAFEAVTLPLSAFGPGPVPLSDAVAVLVDEARARIAALGGVEPHAGYGHAAEELTAYSASVDLLIVGSRGYGPLGRLVHGSTSQHLARTARCPLLVLPRAAGPAGEAEAAPATLLSTQPESPSPA